MAGVSMVLLLFVAIAGLLLLGLVAGIVGMFAARGRSTADGGRCGKCGYIARGLESMHCPECGADLREVGITAASARPKWPIVLTSVCGGMLLLFCTCTGVLATGFRSSQKVQIRHAVTHQQAQQLVHQQALQAQQHGAQGQHTRPVPLPPPTPQPAQP